jgi:hypothetical protein
MMKEQDARTENLLVIEGIMKESLMTLVRHMVLTSRENLWIMTEKKVLILWATREVIGLYPVGGEIFPFAMGIEPERIISILTEKDGIDG